MKLSIITVNLNNREGLRKTIDSVVSQSFKNFEWIVIDGGSTDGSKELIEKYQNHLAYWISEPDNGIYNAMNKGIKVATGEYLLFLNSGDYIVSNDTLNKVFSFGKEEDILYGNIATPKKRNGLNKSLHSNNIYCSDLYHGSLCHQASFIRRKLFDEYGFYDESMMISSDWKFFYEAILIHKCSYHYMDITISYYEPNGISSTNIEIREKERRQVLKEYLPDYVILDYDNNLRTNEVMKYPISRKLFALLYKCVQLYEKLNQFH